MIFCYISVNQMIIDNKKPFYLTKPINFDNNALFDLKKPSDVVLLYLIFGGLFYIIVLTIFIRLFLGWYWDLRFATYILSIIYILPYLILTTIILMYIYNHKPKIVRQAIITYCIVYIFYISLIFYLYQIL